MKRLISVITAMLVLSLSAHAQRSLVDSPQQSRSVAVYRLSADDVRRIQLKDQNISEQMMHDCVGIYASYKEIPQLDRGNYLIVKSQAGNLIYDSHTVDNFHARLVRDGRVQLLLTDTIGRIITDARVRSGSRTLRYDTSTRTYNTSSLKDGSIIEIDNDGVLHYLETNREKPYRYRNRSRAGRNDNDRSFIVLSKPRYKPGETVRFKAYIAPKSRPSKSEAEVHLTTSYGNKDTLLMRLSPYRDGFYEGEFTLGEGLDLRLDRRYPISLRDSRGRWSQTAWFRYEDYLLDAVEFDAKPDRERYAKGEKVEILLTAHDDNNLPVYDAEVEITLRKGYGDLTRYDRYVFVPDTIWHWRQPMTGRRTQRIEIPDSVFVEGTAMEYRAECVLTDATGEQHRATSFFKMDRRREVIDASVRRGIITIRELHDGVSVSTRALLTVDTEEGDLIFRDSVTLPYTAPVDYMASSYCIETETAKEKVLAEDYARDILDCEIVRDTAGNGARVRVDNPSGIPFWYTVQRERNIIDRGYATRLDTLYADRRQHTYALRVVYLVADEAYTLQRSLSVTQTPLSLTVTAPDKVYPGQSTEVEVALTDRRGRPVEGADITAYAYTSRFDRSPSAVPVSLKIRHARPITERADYDIDDNDFYLGRIPLDYELWRDRLGLDTIEFYRFLYPDPLYVHTAPARDSLTTLMPYAVIDGRLQGIHLLWFDGRLCYWHQPGSGSHIVLPVRSGLHRLRMLTADRLVEIDSIDIARGMKNIVSAEVGQSSRGVKVTVRDAKAAGTLSETEYQELQRHVITVEPRFGDVTISGGDSPETLMPLPGVILSGSAVYSLATDDNSMRDYRNYLSRHAAELMPYLAETISEYDGSDYRGFISPHTVGIVPYRAGEIDDGGIASLLADTAHIADFRVEGGYRYDIRPAYQSRTSWRQSPIVRSIEQYSPSTEFRREVPTRESLHADFISQLKERVASRRGSIAHRDTLVGRCLLDITVKQPLGQAAGERFEPLAIALFDRSGLHSLYYGSTRSIDDLRQGRYHIAVIGCDSTQLGCDVDIRSGGTNYLLLDSEQRAESDSLALAALDRLSKMIRMRYPESDAPQRRPHPAGEEYVAAASDAGIYNADNAREKVVTGIVIGQDDGMPLIGVTVRTDSGEATTTDIDGRFRLPCTSGKVLTLSFLGYDPYTTRLRCGHKYRISMQPSYTACGEVTVVAYGSRKRSAYTGSVASAETIQENDSFDDNIIVRGVGTVEVITNVLTTVNCDVALAGELPGIAATDESLPEQLDESEFAEDWRAGGSLRHDFSDEAFWQPRITTDRDGRARFEVTYPDDITAWNANFIAVDGRQQIAHRQQIVRSATPVNARLSLPEFAVRGDSLTAVGRLTNYLADSVGLWRTIVAETTDSCHIVLGNSHIDLIPVTAPDADSLQITYSLATDEGYRDGEQRRIPLLRQGMEAAYGKAVVLTDTLPYTFTPDPRLGQITLHAGASGIEWLTDEIERLTKYRYSCNEQTASKLKAQLARRTIALARGERFDGDRTIKRLIEQLTDPKHRTADGLWGWWGGNSYTPWITEHITEALIQAQQAGYNVSLDRTRMAAALRLRLDRIIDGGALPGADRTAKGMLHTLRTMHLLDPQIDCHPYIDAIAAIDDDSTDTWIRCRQAAAELCGMTADREELLALARHSFGGGLYWSDEEKPRRWYAPDDDPVLTTLAAYRLLRDMGDSDDCLAAIRTWLCQQRGEGQWVNTYLSSRIVETLLPDMLATQAEHGSAAIEIDGRRYDSFPVHLTLGGESPITVASNGAAPIFITLYQSGWEDTPQARAEGFEVESQLFVGGRQADLLEKGVAAELRVSVEAEADAAYVMIEIPIPAGCSYLSKQKSSNPHQVWRESYKERAVIFCNHLPQGTHTFTIELLPRYTGRYHINPARASLMYYPTICGNNESVSCTITEREPIE